MNNKQWTLALAALTLAGLACTCGFSGLPFGTRAGATVGDRVWLDVDGNGIQDEEEVGVPGVTVQLMDNTGQIVEETTTGGDGLYGFADITPGRYTLQFIPPTEFSFTLPNIGTDANVDSDARQSDGRTSEFSVTGKEDLTLDAGLVAAVADADPTLIVEAGPPTIVPTSTEEPPAGESFSDGPNDAFLCVGAESIEDPAVEILEVWYHVLEDGTVAYVRVAQPSENGFADFSYSLNILLGNMSGNYVAARAEIHNSVEAFGHVDQANLVIPGTSDHVTLTEDYASFTFPGVFPAPGDVIIGETYHMANSGAPVHCDVAGPFPLSLNGNGGSGLLSGEATVEAFFTGGSGTCMANPSDFSVLLDVILPGDGTIQIVQPGMHVNTGPIDENGNADAASEEERYIVQVDQDLSFFGKYEYYTPDGICMWDVSASRVP